MVELKVKQWGNSLGLTIPRDIVRLENLDNGDIVKVEISKEKRVNGFGIFRGIPPFKEEKGEHGEFW